MAPKGTLKIIRNIVSEYNNAGKLKPAAKIPRKRTISIKYSKETLEYIGKVKRN